MEELWRSLMAVPFPSGEVKKRGHEKMRRTTGPGYMTEILKRSSEKGWKHYFYGSTEETLERLKTVLEKDYPDIQVVGMYSPPLAL